MTKNALLEMFPAGNPYPVDGDRRRYDPVTAMGGAQIGASLIGGIFQGGAAKKAAEQQARSATEAKDLVGNAVGSANNPISGATSAGQGLVATGGNRVLDTGGTAAAGMQGAVTGANGLLDPYSGAGGDAMATLRSSLAQGGQLNTPFNADNFRQMDPGFDFRLKQVQQAVQRSAAAHGGAMGGGAMRDLSDRTSDYASSEFNNAFQRHETQNNDLFSRLNAVAGMGLGAATKQGDNLTSGARYSGDVTMDAAKTALGANEFGADLGLKGAGMMGDNTMRGAMAQGDYLTQRGNAQAAGTMGSTNAWTNALTGGVQGASNMALLRQLLNRPGAPAQAYDPFAPGQNGDYRGGR